MMILKKNTYMLCTAALLAATLLLLASCAQDDNLPGGSPADSRPALLGLSTLRAADISTVDVSTRAADTREATTRAAVSTPDFPKSQSIGFFVKEDNTHGYLACNNRQGTYNTTRKLWLPTPDSIWLNNHDADIAIYAPYDAAQTTVAALTLTACLRPADGSKDIWCKRFTANNQSKDLAATLEHVYTRLCITVTLAADYKAEAKLTGIALTGKDIYAGTTYKPFEDVPYIYDGKKGVSLTPEAAKVLNTTTTSAIYDLLLIPTATGATLTDDLTLTLTVDGKKMRVKIAKEKFTGTKLEAGKQHNINLKLMPGKLALSSVTVVKWDALAEADGGQAEFDEPSVDWIDIGLNFLIAKGNVIATKQEDSYTYAFAEEQGYYNIANSYFCWNSLEPGIETRYSSWDTDRDICRKIGMGEWYTPSKNQLQTLINCDKKFWGAYTMEDNSTVDGWYLGTSVLSDIADQDKYVFLPAAGQSVWAQISYAGRLTAYWSSTFVADNTPRAHYSSSNYEEPSAFVISDNPTSHMYAVRCVKNKSAQN